jgi:hypothetical protein
VDVRADDRIKPEDAEAFAITEVMCREAGWEFRRVGEPDPLLLANVGWLAGYWHPRFGESPLAGRVAECFASPAPLVSGHPLAQVDWRMTTLMSCLIESICRNRHKQTGAA